MCLWCSVQSPQIRSVLLRVPKAKFLLQFSSRCAEQVRVMRGEIKNLRQQMDGSIRAHKKQMSSLQSMLTDCTKHEDTVSRSPGQLNQLLEQGRIQTVPIGYISSCFAVKNGTPRQPTVCASTRASLKIEASVFNNPEHSLEGLEQYSHIWCVVNLHHMQNRSQEQNRSEKALQASAVTDAVTLVDLCRKHRIIFLFHKNGRMSYKAKVKPPRLNGRRVGLYSTRALGLMVKLERTTDSTRPKFQLLKGPDEAAAAIRGILSADPRSVYRRTRCQDRLFFFTLDTLTSPAGLEMVSLRLCESNLCRVQNPQMSCELPAFQEKLLKRIIHPKMPVLSAFTPPHVLPDT